MSFLHVFGVNRSSNDKNFIYNLFIITKLYNYKYYILTFLNFVKIRAAKSLSCTYSDKSKTVNALQKSTFMDRYLSWIIFNFINHKINF